MATEIKLTFKEDKIRSRRNYDYIKRVAINAFVSINNERLYKMPGEENNPDLYLPLMFVDEGHGNYTFEFDDDEYDEVTNARWELLRVISLVIGHDLIQLLEDNSEKIWLAADGHETDEDGNYLVLTIKD